MQADATTPDPAAPVDPQPVPELAGHAAPVPPPPAPHGPRTGIGIASLLLAAAMLVAGGVATWLGATPDPAAATAPAATALGFAALAVVTGLVAVIAKRGRGFGVIAIVVAILFNPATVTQGVAALVGAG